MSERNKGKIFCSFCGRSSTEVDSMVAGPSVYICNHCVADATGIVKSDLANRASKRGGQITSRFSSRLKLWIGLDEYVIGPGGAAKKALSVAVYNHYKRISADASSEDPNEDVEI